MEIGEQQIDGAEAIARRDEERGLAGERRDAAGPRRRRFREGAALVVPTRDDAPAARARAVEPRRRRRIDACPISPCMWWSSVSADLHRQEGAGADMERDGDALDAGRVERGAGAAR